MFDIKFIRENPDLFNANLTRRGMEPCADTILALDEEIRLKTHAIQQMLARRNEIAKSIPVMKKSGESIDSILSEAEKIKADLPALEKELEALSIHLSSILDVMPNILLEDVHFGGEEDAKLIKSFGTKREFDFTPLEHFEIGEKIGMMDFEQAAKISGARFVILKSQLARMERALANFMIDSHVNYFGYQEVSPPLLVKKDAVYGVGQLPKFEEDLFKTTNDYYLISTSEVSMTNLVADSIVKEEDLPMRFTAYTPCFRSEAGSAGRDTRGMIRQHQFYKVELVSITTPQESKAEHERMLSAAERVLQELELPYRVIMLASKDVGFQSQKTYDIEVWLPGQNRYREISSCSVCGDFQSRRMKSRYKSLKDGKNYYTHTLNGSGLAVGRTLIAILENYQNADGSISIPKKLQPYMNGLERITNI